MFSFKGLTAVVVTGALLGLILPAGASTKKGDRFLGQGRVHEQKKEWDAALDEYEKALSEDPAEIVYQMAAQKARLEASAVHVSNATRIRALGQLGDALVEFQKAYALNPGSTVAQQEILRTQEMIARERKHVEETGKETPPADRGMTPADVERKTEGEKIDRMQGVPVLRPLTPNLIDFKLVSETPKVLFESVARYAGLNVLWDPEYDTAQTVKTKLSVDFDNSTIEQALDYLAVVTKSYWKPLSPNTIFITVDNPTKRRDYEEEVTKIFYLTNAVAPQEVTDMVTAVRTVADCTRLFPYNALYAIIAKCSSDRMALAEKIIHDLDKPRAEVVVDILVIEASSSFMKNIAAGLGTTGLNVPFAFSPRSSLQVQGSTTTTGTTGTTTTGTTTGTTGTTTATGTNTSSTTGALIPLSQLGHLSSADFATTLPSALLQATLSDTRSKVLQSPQIRSVDGQKATMKIGQREPTASGSFGSGIGGIGGSIGGASISPLVQTQFQYIDVGVNVEIQPHVHDNGEISMHVSLDISNITGYSNLGGINQPIIGQRKIEHDIRLREGEVSLLAGLLNQSENKTKAGTPGLGSIPILGRLFSGTTTDRERDELMIALIPHVVRRTEITAENLREVASGNSTVFHVSYRPRAADPAAAPAGKEEPAPPAASAPAGAAAAGGPPVVPPATVPPATAPSVIALPGSVPPGNAPPPAAPGAATRLMPPATAPPEGTIGAPPGAPPLGSATFRFDVTQVEKSVSDTVTVTLLVAGAKDVASAPIEIQFDPKILSLTDVTRGGFWTSGGQEPILTKNLQNETGTAAVRISAKPEAGSISGSGPLFTLTFKAVAKGTGTIKVSSLTLQNAQGQLLATGSPQVTVNVK